MFQGMACVGGTVEMHRSRYPKDQVVGKQSGVLVQWDQYTVVHSSQGSVRYMYGQWASHYGEIFMLRLIKVLHVLYIELFSEKKDILKHDQWVSSLESISICCCDIYNEKDSVDRQVLYCVLNF